MTLSPILFFVALDYLKEHSSKEQDCVLCSTNEEHSCCCSANSCCCEIFCAKKEKPLIRSVTILVYYPLSDRGFNLVFSGAVIQ